VVYTLQGGEGSETKVERYRNLALALRPSIEKHPRFAVIQYERDIVIIDEPFIVFDNPMTPWEVWAKEGDACKIARWLNLGNGINSLNERKETLLFIAAR